MCKEKIHFPVKTLKVGELPPRGCRHEVKKPDAEHHHHDDAENKAHANYNHTKNHIHHHTNEHTHQHHEDVVSLAHQHPIHLQSGTALFRQSACHAGDGHAHGSSRQVSAIGFSPPIGRVSLGGGHHHPEDEHEHCPKCDEHLVDDKCEKCGYEHK
jgi:hypothetical protein